MTPSETLNAAADLIRDLAAKASPAPWSAGSVDEETGQFFGLYGDFGWTVHGPSGTAELEDTERGLADCRWIAALSPALAPMIERWLRETSRHVRTFGENADGWAAAPALAFAEAILRSGVDTQ